MMMMMMMMMMMSVKLFVSITVLQLAHFDITAEASEFKGMKSPSPAYKFGDIIAFEYFSKGTGGQQLAFVHFAVYVGEEEGLRSLKKPDENIFLLNGIKPLQKEPQCVFGKLNDVPQMLDGSMTLTRSLANFLDDGLKVRGKEDMIKEIKALHSNCQGWNPLVNPCKHLAMHIRYDQNNIELKETSPGECVIKKK